MEEMIRVKNVSYDRYEELLMRRDAVKKATAAESSPPSLAVS